jgi:hypothetical protein
MEVVFCEGLQHRMRFCLDHLSCARMAVAQFIFNQENRKLGLVGDYNHCFFVKKFSGEKGSVRRCVVVMQQPVPLSPKFGAKSSHIFTQSL